MLDSRPLKRRAGVVMYQEPGKYGKACDNIIDCVMIM